jgi:hypothetical protein
VPPPPGEDAGDEKSRLRSGGKDRSAASNSACPAPAAVDEVDSGGVGAVGVADEVGGCPAPPCEWKCRDEDDDEKSSSM